MSRLLPTIFRPGFLLAVFASACLGADAPDYRNAFSLFMELGFPDVSSGRLVHVEARYAPLASLRLEDPDGLPLPNAWLMRAPSNAPAELVDLFGRPFRLGELTPSDPEEEETPDGRAEGIVDGHWEKSDPAVFIGSLTNQVGRKGNKEVEDPFRSGSYDQDARLLYASAFFLAAGLSQQGRSAEAKVLAEAVLAPIQNREAFLTTCISILANRLFEEAQQKARKGGDGIALADDIDAIRARFGDVWVDDEMAAEIAALARERARGVSDLPAGVAPDWVRQCLAELLSNPVDDSPLQALSRYPWVLAPQIDPAAVTNGTPPLIRLLDGGMASIPALLAVATNRTFILKANDNGRGGDDYTPPDHKFILLLMQANREDHVVMSSMGIQHLLKTPPTLGSLAMELLYPLVEERNFNLVLAEVRDWYDLHRNDTRMDLAFHFLLDSGKFYQSSQVAIETIAYEGTTADVRRLEQVLASLPSARQSLSLAQRFIDHADPALSAGFKSNLVAALRAKDAPAAEDSELFVKEGRPDPEEDTEIGKAIAEFLGEVPEDKPPPLEQVLDNYVSGTNALDDEVLYGSLIGTPTQRALSLVTNAVLRAETPDRRVRLMRMVPHVLSYSGREEPEVVAPRSDQRPERLVPEWRKEEQSPARKPRGKSPLVALEVMTPFWQALLAEPRSPDWRDCRVVAANLMEQLYGTPYSRDGAGLLGESWDDLMVSRALARLEKRPLPDLPVLAKAITYDRSTLERDLLALPEAALPDALARLDPLPLLSLITAPEPAPALAARLAALSSRVASAPPGLGVAVGQRLTTNAVEAMLRSISGTNGEPAVTIVLKRLPCARGIAIAMTNGVPAGSSETYMFSHYMAPDVPMGESTTPVARVMGYATATLAKGRQVQSSSGILFNILDSSRPVREGNLDAEIETRYSYSSYSPSGDPDEFWKAAESVLAATNSPLAPAGIRLYRVTSREPEKDDRRLPHFMFYD